MIFSKKNFNFYQKFEIRCKMPGDIDFMKAFWVFGWTAESDIFETIDPNHPQHTLHHYYGDGNTDSCESYSELNINPGEWHTYAVEHDLYSIRYLVDDNVVVTLYKLNYLSPNPTPVTTCEVAPGVYTYSDCFSTPSEGEPYSIIANFDVGPTFKGGDEPIGLQLPAIWEIDYIRVYKRKPCEDYTYETLVRVSSDALWESDINVKSIIVDEDVTLTIKGAKVEFIRDGGLYLDEGAKLILDDAILTSASCAIEKWNGVKADDNAHIEMKNRSIIENANIGIKLGEPPLNGSFTSTFGDNAKLIMDSYSGIRNCNVGVQLGVGQTSTRMKGHSWFKFNNIGILAINSNGLKLDETEFYDNLEAIRAVDSYIHVRDGNAFHGGSTGISVEGTFPGVAGIDIGDMGQGWNLFGSNMENGIICYGSEHAAGANIVNCQFTNMSNAATLFDGANQYEYYNNTIDRCPTGVYSFATRGNINENRCNVFKDIKNAGNIYLYNNKYSEFLENHFIGETKINYSLLSASVADNIGYPGNPAGNCFSETGRDIVTLRNSIPFNYHFYDDDHTIACQEPFNPGGYIKERSDNKPNHCDGDIGIFYLIDPDKDGKNGFVVDLEHFDIFEGHISTDEIYIEIFDKGISTIIENSGDDPLTTIDETIYPQTIKAVESEKVLDQWIRYAIYRGLLESNFEFIESVLTPLQKWKWRKQHYGVSIIQGNYVQAKNILDAMSSGSEEEIYFKGVQEINLKRLGVTEEGNWITEQDISYLKDVASSEYPSSGYAKSLLKFLTGKQIEQEVPDMDEYIEDIPSEGGEESEHNNITIYPNPANGEIVISSEKYVRNILIMDWSRQVLINKEVEGISTNVDIESLNTGVYFVLLTYINGSTQMGDFIKN